MNTTTSTIPLDAIDDPHWNSRLIVDTPEAEAKLKELMESMSGPSGQLQPIKVEGPSPEGRFLLIFGKRRLTAARNLKWETIRAEIAKPTNETSRVLSNLIENLQRSDLSTYEKARGIGRLAEDGMSDADIAANVGLSKSAVTNYRLTFQKLDPTILQAWQSNEKATSDSNFLRKLASQTAPKQLAEFEKRKELIAVTDDIMEGADINGKPNGKKKPGRKPTGGGKYGVPHQRFLDACRAVQESQGKDKAKPIIACFRFLIGEQETVKGYIELKQDKGADA